MRWAIRTSRLSKSLVLRLIDFHRLYQSTSLVSGVVSNVHTRFETSRGGEEILQPYQPPTV